MCQLRLIQQLELLGGGLSLEGADPASVNETLGLDVGLLLSPERTLDDAASVHAKLNLLF